MNREDLSPNDPRAVIEDPVLIREEKLLAAAGKLFLHGARVAVIAVAVYLLIPEGRDGALRILRTLALWVFALSAIVGLVAPINPLLKYYRLRK